MALYTQCLHPFLTDLEGRLPGVRLDRRSRPVSVVAYADDVSLSYVGVIYLDGGGCHTSV
jgi:hypothetical protein